MRKLYSLLFTLFFTQVALAQWPANYGGVMLQGFYWNSFEDSNLTAIQDNVDEWSKFFDIVWLPNTGATGSEGMGYMPVYWFNHNSNFGRQKTLKNVIKAFNEKGTKVIEDVVINHKAPKGTNGSWVDFVNETWTWEGTKYNINWTPADICRNDDGGYTNTVGASDEMKEQNGGWECTGADDTGDDFSGGRDLDHTSANVQNNVKLYLDFLLKDLGYSGFRLDMVKGYSASFTKLYNEYAKPEFCVGEYWDGYDAITNWIKGTDYTSAAFDFPLKYKLNEACGSGNWGALSDKGIVGDPNFNRYSVTFIDNHDTYENSSRLVNNVLPANAFILAMPGTPCIFLKHWQRYPIAIGNMILARKACGITNQSSITTQEAPDGGYVIKVQGTKGTVLCIVGYPSYDTTGFKLISSGINYAYFVSDNIDVDALGLTEGDDDEETVDMTIYVKADKAPYLYAWNSSGTPVNGAWPGTQLTNSKEIDGVTFWTRTFTKAPVNIIFNDGGDIKTDADGNAYASGQNAVQTADIEKLTHDSYFTFDPTNSDKTTNFTDITDQYYTPAPVVLPPCVKALEGHLYCYFLGSKDYDSPCAWVWGNGDKNFCQRAWPGDRLERVGDDGKGHLVWLWDAGDMEELFGSYTPDASLLPTGVLFNNNNDDSSTKTKDFVFENGGYYDATGKIGDVTAIGSVLADKVQKASSKYVYNLNGQRVNNSYKGIVIKNGKKILTK